MSEKKRNELKNLIILLIIILLFTNGHIAHVVRSTVFARITWEQLVLGLISLRIVYILLINGMLGKKNK